MVSPVRLYNTLSQSLEPLEPLEPGHVRIYLCGLTTYDHAHLGHARTNSTFDVLVRFLRARGLRVTFVRNVTDVDDKILHRAAELCEDPLTFSARMAHVNDGELKCVGCLVPDHEPRVSGHLDDIVRLIEALIARDAAYVVDTGDVYFAVRGFAEYGKLSHRNVDDLRVGARVEADDRKRDPLDFALWKASGDQTWGWPSPWGRGRPGWHIECSAMAARYLGEHFDIHGGGMDLIFPHHENEIAQSEAVWGAPFAKLWMHAGFLNVDTEKMSKSLGNFVTIRDVLATNDPEAIRYFFLGAHYRGPIDFDVERRGERVVFPGLDEAEARVDYLYGACDALTRIAGNAEPEVSDVIPGVASVIRNAEARVLSALAKDLNTPVALAVLGDLAKAANELALQVGKLKKDPKRYEGAVRLAAAGLEVFRRCTTPLGLMQVASDVYVARTRGRRLAQRGLDAASIDAKVEERTRARTQKDFARSDAIRAELTELGVELLDFGGVTGWKIPL
ncbi:MAG: cysteine--tRNA ligase [Myxococcales bacterium]